jgi:endonuclease/exonuclease/phosphatase family metal-dependent hydrolase
MSPSRRRKRSSFAKQLRWFALIALAASAVAFGREPGKDAAAPPPAPPKPRQGSGVDGGDPPRSAKRYAQLDTPFFRSADECESALRGRPRRSPQAAPRIATWNLRWFPRGTKDGRDLERRSDVRWLACAIASLEVDVLAVQEVVQDPEGRAALLDMSERLDQLTGGRWSADLDECGGSGRQHVGLLYDASRVQLSDAGEIAALNPGRSACDHSLRPGYSARARFADGSEAQLIAVHLDSGMQPRDFGNRRISVERLRDVLPQLRREHGGAEPIVLGDFNTMGCAECQPATSAADELSAFDAELASLQLKRVPGAQAQLCSEYYRGHAGLLDHVVIASDAGQRLQHAELHAYGACAALACTAPPRGQAVAAFERLSDHCPLVLELAPSPRTPAPVPAPPRKRATRR